MPIECGGVCANTDQTRSFNHRNGDDIYEIKLKGQERGGVAIVSHYSVHHVLPRQSFAQWLIDPVPQRVEDKSYISTRSYEVGVGEEVEILNTGLYATGS